MSKNQRNYRKRSFSSSEEDESTLWNPSRTDRSSPDLSRQNSSHHRSQHESTSRQRIDQELFQLRVRSHYLLQDPNRDARNGPQPPKKARKSHREAADYMMSPPRDWSRAERSCLGYKRKAPPDGGKWQHDMWQWQDNPGGNNSAQPNDWESNSRGPVQNRDGNNSAQPNNWESNSRGPVQNRDGNNSAQPNNWKSNSRGPVQNRDSNNSAQPNDWESNSCGSMQNRDGNNSAQPNNWESNSHMPTQKPNSSAQRNSYGGNSGENKGPASQGLNRSFPLPCVPPSTQASATETRPASPIKYKIFNARGVIPGMKLLVKPSVVSNLDSIYLWNEQWDQQLLSLQSQVASHACQPGGVAMKLDVGDACLAKHLGIWFRATVLAKPANGMVNVLLADYGDQISVNLNSSVKSITEQLAKPHALAIHCSLRGATPTMGSFWSPSEIVLFLNTVEGKVLQSLFVALETTKGLKFSVVLYDGQMCINQIFGAKPHSLLPCMTLPYQPSPAGNAIISYFINPGLFSIHLTCQKYTMSNMERQIEEMDPTLKLQTADKGELVLAPRHNAYHRARVLDVKNGRAKCHFFDLGVTNLMKVMKISELLPMPDSLKQVGPLRYDVKLVGVEPTNGLQWAEKCPKTDKIFLSHPDFELITAVKPSDEELWQVELKQPGTTSTLSELLIRSQIANKALTGTFAAGGLLQVRVSYFQTSPTLTIHLQEKNRQMNLEALQAKLKSLNLSSANPHIPVFGSGALAAARSPEDGEWYRVLPMFMKEGNVNVYFVDYGNEDIVSEMRELPADLVKLPYFSQPCRLPVKPTDSDTFSPETLAKIEEMLFKEGQTITAQIYCRDDKAIMMTDILIGQQSLSEFLITEKLATSVIMNGYVSSVISQYSFYIQLAEDEGKIHQMEDRLVKEEFEKQERVRKDHDYIAKFKDDKAWYRAKVVNISARKVVTVLFYDYGNTAVSTEFKKMPEDMKSIPPLAKHCTLHLMPTSRIEIDKFITAALDGTILYKFIYMNEVAGLMEVVMLKDDKDLKSSSFELRYPLTVQGQLFLPTVTLPAVPCQSPVVSVEPCHSLLTSPRKKAMASVEPPEVIVIDLSPEPSPAGCEIVDTLDETVETPDTNTETAVETREENAETAAKTHGENLNTETAENHEENAEPAVNNREENLNTFHVHETVAVEIETSSAFCQQEPEVEQNLETNESKQTTYQEVYNNLKEIHQEEGNNE